jgi:hypothetical protein
VCVVKRVSVYALARQKLSCARAAIQAFSIEERKSGPRLCKIRQRWQWLDIVNHRFRHRDWILSRPHGQDRKPEPLSSVSYPNTHTFASEPAPPPSPPLSS